MRPMIVRWFLPATVVWIDGHWPFLHVVRGRKVGEGRYRYPSTERVR